MITAKLGKISQKSTKMKGADCVLVSGGVAEWDKANKFFPG